MAGVSRIQSWHFVPQASTKILKEFVCHILHRPLSRNEVFDVLAPVQEYLEDSVKVLGTYNALHVRHVPGFQNPVQASIRFLD